MFSYEYTKASQELEEIKEELKAYLLSSYKKDKHPEKVAKENFIYLEKVISRIIKRKKYQFQFSAGGSPSWHATIFSFMSKWLRAEEKINKILCEDLEEHLD
jgi:hypothetical protein